MNEGEKLPPGEPSLEMYLKLAECFMRKGKFEQALYNIGEAADFNPDSTVRDRAQSFTSLKADLRKDIYGGFAFSRCLKVKGSAPMALW